MSKVNDSAVESRSSEREQMPRKCPTCDSPSPELHPAIQHEGEVQTCSDAWHQQPTNRTPLPPLRESRSPQEGEVLAEIRRRLDAPDGEPGSFASFMDSIDSSRIRDGVYEFVVYHMRKAAAAEAALAESRSTSDELVYEPNVWVCATCGFENTKMLLRAADGAVAIDSREVQDVCPNDGTSLRRRRWKEAAEQAVANAIRFMNELESLRSTSDAQRQEIERKYRQLATAAWPDHPEGTSHGGLVQRALANHWKAVYHSECRPNREQALAAMADAKAVNDRNADLIRENRELKAAADAQQRQAFEKVSEIEAAFRRSTGCSVCYLGDLMHAERHDADCPYGIVAAYLAQERP